MGEMGEGFKGGHDQMCAFKRLLWVYSMDNRLGESQNRYKQ